MGVYSVDGKKYRIPDTDPQTGKAMTPARLDEILTKLVGPQKSPIEKAGEALGKGVTHGLTQAAGAPVDIATSLLNLPADLGGSELFGMPRIESPMGGSEHLQSLLSEGPEARGATPLMSGPRLNLPAMTYKNIQDVPEAFRPIARMGEVLGSSAPFAAAPLAAARSAGTKPATGTFAPMVEAARTAPGSFAAAEAASAGGAGAGSMAAEAFAPGRPGVRMGAEAFGGAVNPMAALITSTGTLSRNVKNLIPTRARREQEAADRAVEMVTSLGEEPSAVAGRLREAPHTGAPLTAGQKAQSPALLALQSKLKSESGNLGIEMQQRFAQSIEDINLAFRQAGASGDPNALKAVAEARQEHWRSLLDTAEAMAQGRIEGAARMVRPTVARREANVQARELVDTAMRAARQEESRLWETIPRDIDMPVAQRTNLATAEAEAGTGLLPTETLDLPAAINAEVGRLLNPETAATSGELLRLRSRIATARRNIRGSQAPDWDMDRRLGILQSGVMDDLAAVDASADTARAFSREFHERITQTPAGRALSRDVRGAGKIEPELTLEKTLVPKRGPERAAVARQLEEAVEPFGDMPATTAPQEMRQAQNQLLRDLATETFDPATGRPDAAALAKFRTNNRELLRRFPELDETFSSAQSVVQRYGDRLKTLAKRDKQIRQSSAFAKVLKGDDPVGSVSRAMDSLQPAKELGGIFSMAAKSPDALKGANRALLESLYAKATLPNGLVSGQRLMDELGKFTQVAKRFNVLNDDQIKRIQQVASEATKLEEAVKFSGQLDAAVGDVSDLYDLLVRITGANIGASAGIASASGASLVTAGYGSRAMRKWLERVPQNRVKDVLVEATMNPYFMADLLKKGRVRTRGQLTARGAVKTAGRALSQSQQKRIHGYLLQIGLPEEE